MDDNLLQSQLENLAMKGGYRHSVPIYASWNVRVMRGDQVLSEEDKTNLIVDTGRTDVLDLLFNLTGQAALVGLGVGASSTAAVHTDTRLNYEYTATDSAAGPTKRYTLTNTSGAALSASDVVSDTFTDGLGNTFYKKIVVQSIIPTTDPNVGQPFQEYGLFTSQNLPATPTSTSGLMFNHLVAASAIIKDGSTQIVVQITLRV